MWATCSVADAEVKIDAFLYTKYGTVKGKVTHVSRDAIADEKKGLIYSTKIMLDRSTMNIDVKDIPAHPPHVGETWRSRPATAALLNMC